MNILLSSKSDQSDHINSIPVTNECCSSKLLCSIAGLISVCAANQARLINKGHGLILVNDWAVLADVKDLVECTVDEMTGLDIYTVSYEISFY